MRRRIVTSPVEPANPLPLQHTPLVEQGYRVALLWTASTQAAEEIVEETFDRVMRLMAAGGLTQPITLVYFGALLCGLCDLVDLPSDAPLRWDGSAVDLLGIAGLLRRLGLLCRAAVILDLAAGLPTEDIARILGYPTRVIHAALHLGHDELGRLRIPFDEEGAPGRQ
jgi:DNA-directed RNA polymerase specialized sigma24 family protein